MILGTPFLILLYHSQVGLITNTIEKEVCFEFIKPPKIRELNLLKESSIFNIEGKRKEKSIK